MRERIRRILITGALLLLPVVLLGGSAWRISSKAKEDSTQAFTEGRTVMVRLPSGDVEGGGVVRGSKRSTALPGGPSAKSSEMAAALIPPPGEGLKAAPHPEITEDTDLGPLPAVGKDGMKAWRYYAKEFTVEKGTPTLAIVVSGLGLSKQVGDLALRLPAAISLSFSPYARESNMWAGSARALGHEVFVDLPLEPTGYPAVDPGPKAILGALPDEVNEKHLEWVLSRFPGYVGVMALPGERLLYHKSSAQPVLQQLGSRGVMLIIGNTNTSEPVTKMVEGVALPFVQADAEVEAEDAHDEMLTQLMAAETAARRKGSALVVVNASPLALRALAQWAEQLEKKGIILAPVSALARQKFS